jgi:hypothetical protein
MEKIDISGFDLQRWPLHMIISFCKMYIWDLGLRFGLILSDHAIQTLFRVMNLKVVRIFPTVKSIFFRNIYFLKSNSYFQGTVMYVQYGFIFYTDPGPNLQCDKMSTHELSL